MANENEIVSIPGLKNRDPKEISVKNLASIIQARMEEIIESVYYEIRNSGFEKKLIAGIVVTGGGSQLKHINQLIEYITGMDSRIGLPNEHLGKGLEEVKSPMYATGVGLVLNGMAIDDEAKIKVEKPQGISEEQSQRRGNWFKHIFKELLTDESDDKLL